MACRIIFLRFEFNEDTVEEIVKHGQLLAHNRLLTKGEIAQEMAPEAPTINSPFPFQNSVLCFHTQCLKDIT